MAGVDPITVNGEERIVHSIPNVPITVERKPYINYDKHSALQQPSVARANLAPSAESPHGSTENEWAKKHAHQTVLQQHCDFFDRDHDSILWPQDTFVGFHRLGYNAIFCFVAMLVIHINFSYATCSSWLPDPFFRLFLVNVHRARHGSDTQTYDPEGRFQPARFEEIFSKYAGGRDYLTIGDFPNMLRGQRNISDPIGWGGFIFEWSATWIMLWPEDGRMMKEDIRAIYDGSIFYKVAERRENKKKW
ncbi:Caleosin-domain-containing protein [Decorospora gaudefroyi]|uniref:Caleosin-domain-containing protein n=1 Tax=Decorospora gaudefroyi TaxID=184978 RepID=A0A6A5KM34_9PLEO|nr:Caleosin-domain-containing protein [Decorospora gaudefroyi]